LRQKNIWSICPFSAFSQGGAEHVVAQMINVGWPTGLGWDIPVSTSLPTRTKVLAYIDNKTRALKKAKGRF
jgi:hypothetical protein